MEQLIKTLFISLLLSFGINFEIIAQESKLVTKINKQKQTPPKKNKTKQKQTNKQINK